MHTDQYIKNRQDVPILYGVFTSHDDVPVSVGATDFQMHAMQVHIMPQNMLNGIAEEGFTGLLNTGLYASIDALRKQYSLARGMLTSDEKLQSLAT